MADHLIGQVCLSFDPVSSVDDGLSPAEISISGRYIVEALMVAFVIIVIDEAPDLMLSVSW